MLIRVIYGPYTTGQLSVKLFDQEAESQLVTRLYARDETAMTYFYTNYRQALYMTIWRIVREEGVAQDVLQESMLKFWLSFPAYDSRKGRLFTWALNIARNLAIDRLRAARQNTRRAQPLTEEVMARLTAPAFNPDHIGVRDWLALLSPTDQHLLDVLYFQGFTHTEAAEALHLPLGTVKTRIGRIIRTLTRAVG